MRRWKILLVDDDALYRDAVQLRLQQEEYEVFVADNADDACLKLRTEELDLAILDLRLKDGDPQDFGGLDVAAAAAQELPKVVITQHNEVQIDEYFGALEGRSVPQDRIDRPMFKYGKNGGLEKILQEVRRKLVPRVFIAHGHHEGWRDRVRDRVKQLGLRPYLLADEPIQGATVIEQLEAAAELAHFAIVLLTGDDQGGPRVKPDELKPRARQNVVFELGYFAAALERKRVVALCEPGVEIPSNYRGVRYIDLDSHGDWKDKLATELRGAGINLELYRSSVPA